MLIFAITVMSVWYCHRVSIEVITYSILNNFVVLNNAFRLLVFIGGNTELVFAVSVQDINIPNHISNNVQNSV